MANYGKAKVKLTKCTTKQIKICRKSQTEAILRTEPKNHQDEELPHELFLIIRQKIEIRNAFANSMLTDIKLSKSQLS